MFEGERSTKARGLRTDYELGRGDIDDCEDEEFDPPRKIKTGPKEVDNPMPAQGSRQLRVRHQVPASISRKRLSAVALGQKEVKRAGKPNTRAKGLRTNPSLGFGDEEDCDDEELDPPSKIKPEPKEVDEPAPTQGSCQMMVPDQASAGSGGPSAADCVADDEEVELESQLAEIRVERRLEEKRLEEIRAERRLRQLRAGKSRAT